MPKLYFTWIGLAAGAVYWLLESGLHAFVFTPQFSLMQTLAGEYDPNELFMRTVIILLLAGMGAVYDIHARHRQRLFAHTKRLNRLLDFLSHVNQVVQRQTDEQKAFQETCTAAVERGGFRFAWIGLREGDADGLRPVAKAACSGAVLNDVLRAKGDCIPCMLGTEAVSHGQPAHCNLMTESQCSAAWREPLLEHGCRSAAAFPVRREHECIGAFCVYAEDKGFFKDDEIRILDEAADDISHTLNRFAAEAQRAQTKEAMQKRLDELERFKKATVQREFRIKELRDEIAALKGGKE
ncbi:MAG: GAF domain-containing protein [Mariprofundus sp.]|nr:GAF domain-containing protein [Mariprofundus sp.]